MNEKILNYIKLIEENNNIKVIHACETGSRAWGFPSPDSDYDVRTIYVHKLNWYLSLNEGKDSFDEMYENNDIDITGWELRKTLRLLWKSNASLLERIQSPIIYKQDTTFQNNIFDLAQSCYSKVATMHHYLSMAKNFLEDLDSSEYKLKKFFYTLRAATACKWILDSDEMPPIDFHVMLKKLPIDKSIVEKINELIELKSTKSEAYLHKGEEDIFQFIKTSISKAESASDSLPAAKGNIEDLNALLRSTINL